MSKNETNSVELVGVVLSEFRLDHEVFGEKFYRFDLRVERLSGNYDVIPVMASEKLVDISENAQGCAVQIGGSFRSYNWHDQGGEKSRLVLTVFASSFEYLESKIEDQNKIHLNGYICKSPVYRETPLGREITDVLIAVNRDYGKSDYIPCVCWGRNAKFVERLEVGTLIAVDGRIQSREYVKRHTDGTEETRTAYEVSAHSVNVKAGE